MSAPARSLALISAPLIVLSLLAGGPAVAASSVTASDLPALLTISEPTTSPAYSRAAFEHWVDDDGDGCNTRYEVLIEESTTPVTVGPRCSLTGGTWISPYGGTLAYSPAEIEIDHVVALAEAWRSGASAWTDAQRRTFANDLDVPYALSVASTTSNQSKADRDPARWMPTNSAYHCEYVTAWALTKYRWSLTVDQAESDAIAAVLSGACGATPVALPTVAVAAAPLPQPTETTPPTSGSESSDGSGAGATVVTPFPAGLTRLSGIDRYQTAIAVSQRYAPGVPAVFLSTGGNFPDALSAAAAAATLGAPLLLTSPTALDAAVDSELRRLAPQQIYIVGDTNAVSAQIAATLAGIAPVTRLGGIDRYATGAQIVTSAFSSAPAVFVATGRNFPDALAATGAAGSLGAPVVLVDGMQGAASASALSSILALGVSQIYVVGSSASVSDGIARDLATIAPVSRFGGIDRYATAAAINDHFFGAGSSTTAFLATGTNFPDALAGAALAGQLKAPLFITQPTCMPGSIIASMNRLGATATVVLGSDRSVSAASASGVDCATVPVGPGAPGVPPVTPPVPANPGDTKNCSDFRTWREAQTWFETYFPHYGDVARLDGDGDGIACQSLPGAP